MSIKIQDIHWTDESDMIHTSLLISNFAVPKKKKVTVRDKEGHVRKSIVLLFN